MLSMNHIKDEENYYKQKIKELTEKDEYNIRRSQRQQKEIERLKRAFEVAQEELNKEHNRTNTLKNIIDELEKVLNEEVMLRYHGNDDAKENKIFNAGGMLYRDYIKDTLKALKEGNKDE